MKRCTAIATICRAATKTIGKVLTVKNMKKPTHSWLSVLGDQGWRGFKAYLILEAILFIGGQTATKVIIFITGNMLHNEEIMFLCVCSVIVLFYNLNYYKKTVQKQKIVPSKKKFCTVLFTSLFIQIKHR